MPGLTGLHEGRRRAIGGEPCPVPEQGQIPPRRSPTEGAPWRGGINQGDPRAAEPPPPSRRPPLPQQPPASERTGRPCGCSRSPPTPRPEVSTTDPATPRPRVPEAHRAAREEAVSAGLMPEGPWTVAIGAAASLVWWLGDWSWHHSPLFTTGGFPKLVQTRRTSPAVGAGGVGSDAMPPWVGTWRTCARGAPQRSVELGLARRGSAPGSWISHSLGIESAGRECVSTGSPEEEHDRHEARSAASRAVAGPGP